jgi:hypothetical protein
MVFQARKRGKKPFHFIEKEIQNKILLDIRLLFVGGKKCKQFVHRIERVQVK